MEKVVFHHHPRFLILSDGTIVLPPKVKVMLFRWCCFLGGAIKRISVLSSFNLSKFSSIHFSISQTQRSTLEIVIYIVDGLITIYICESSGITYIIHVVIFDDISYRSAIISVFLRPQNGTLRHSERKFNPT